MDHNDEREPTRKELAYQRALNAFVLKAREVTDSPEEYDALVDLFLDVYRLRQAQTVDDMFPDTPPEGPPSP